MTAFPRGPAFDVGTQAVTPDPWAACTPVLPDRLTSPCYLRWISGMGIMWVCRAQLDKEKKFKTNLHLHAGCLASPQGWWPRGWQQVAGEGALMRVLGTGALPALPRGNHGIRSACIIAVGKGGMPGALPSLQSWALDSQANKREAKENSRNFILHLNLLMFP